MKSEKKSGSNNVAKDGFEKEHFGADEGAMNYRIEDGYEKKDESPAREEGTSIHEIAHHSVTGELYSGDPGRHGHMGKSPFSKKHEA